MQQARPFRQFKRHALALFAPAFDALTGYMSATGLLAYADEPSAGAGDGAAGDAGGEPSLMADAKPADGAAGSDGKPAEGAAGDGAPGDKAAGDGAAGAAGGEAKTDDKPADGEKKPEGDKPAAKAPETYTFKAPEGFEISEALSAEFSPVLRDLDLTQEQADKLVAFAPKLIEPAVDAAVASTLDSLGYSGCKDWAATAKTDKEFGGDKFAENLATVKAARDQFASPELRKLLETTVLGNHPEVLRLFYRIGKQITSDGYVPNGKATGGTSDARRMYAASNMNP